MAEASSSVGDCETTLTSGIEAVSLKESKVQLVVAIDIGTTYSGYAWSFSSTPFEINAMEATDPFRSEGSTVPTKVPTTVLLNPDQTFHSFGHEAVSKYHNDLKEEGEQNNWYYFERFKMDLHKEEKLSKKTSVSAANGKKLPILIVFAHALRHFKGIAIKQCQSNSDVALDESLFKWVITVPAIWKVGAKQLMREAAYEAGLASREKPEKLVIALEPESASLRCKNVKRLGQAEKGEKLIARAFTPGTTYVLADLGGGTADITAHQVTDDDCLREMHRASGGAWGGIYVDKNFIQLLETVFGEDAIKEYETKHTSDWIQLISKTFEGSKRSAIENSAICVDLPYTFHKFFSDRVEDMIAATGNSDIQFKRSSLVIKYPEVKKLFHPVFENIANHLENFIFRGGIDKVDYIILVGGFSTCQLLQNYIRNRLEEDHILRVVVPRDSSLAVVMGAVLFGHNPTTIKSRRSRYSYGIQYLESSPTKLDPSDLEQMSPEAARLFRDNQLLAKRFKFRTFVARNQEVPFAEEVTHSFSLVNNDQEKAEIVVYESDKRKTRLIDDEGVRQIAQLYLVVPNVSSGESRRRVQVGMKFGLTEIQVYTLDMSSGNRVETSVETDFLS